MALTPCPDCERPISNRAYSCPQCGFPLASQMLGSQQFSHNQLDSLYVDLNYIIQNYIFVSIDQFNKKILVDNLREVLSNHESTSDSSIGLFQFQLKQLEHAEIQRFYNSPKSILKRLDEACEEERQMYYSDRYA